MTATCWDDGFCSVCGGKTVHSGRTDAELIMWAKYICRNAGYDVIPLMNGDMATVLDRITVSATDVMNALAHKGPSIVPHLLDDDDNAGEQLRRAILAANRFLGFPDHYFQISDPEDPVGCGLCARPESAHRLR